MRAIRISIAGFCSALLLVVCVYFASAVGTTDSVAARFKAPNAATPATTVQTWSNDDAALWQYVNEHVPAVMEHTGASAFDEHLKGVQAVLRYWNAPDHLPAAGLFHSIYGTEGFQGFKLPLSERAAIQKMIGAAAEKLCFVFCMVDRSTLDDTVFAWSRNNANTTTTSDNETSRRQKLDSTYTLYARPEFGRFPMKLTTEEWLDFVELSLADWLEQVEGAALKENAKYLWKKGQAYSYRRLAYRQMKRLLATERSERLGTVVPQMYSEVMETENRDTRHLLQRKTPPQSTAALEALDALRANGEEDLPSDFSPLPFQENEGEREPSCASDTTNAVME
jgi:hypothetical protein